MQSSYMINNNNNDHWPLCRLHARLVAFYESPAEARDIMSRKARLGRLAVASCRTWPRYQTIHGADERFQRSPAYQGHPRAVAGLLWKEKWRLTFLRLPCNSFNLMIGDSSKLFKDVSILLSEYLILAEDDAEGFVVEHVFVWLD